MVNWWCKHQSLWPRPNGAVDRCWCTCWVCLGLNACYFNIRPVLARCIGSSEANTALLGKTPTHYFLQPILLAVIYVYAFMSSAFDMTLPLYKNLPFCQTFKCAVANINLTASKIFILTNLYNHKFTTYLSCLTTESGMWARLLASKHLYAESFKDKTRMNNNMAMCWAMLWPLEQGQVNLID